MGVFWKFGPSLQGTITYLVRSRHSKELMIFRLSRVVGFVIVSWRVLHMDPFLMPLEVEH